MGAEVGARGAAGNGASAAVTPANQVEAFFAAKPLPTGLKVDYKAYYVNAAANESAATLTASFPNTFETVLAKRR
jgi:hypothetical protein